MFFSNIDNKLFSEFLMQNRDYEISFTRLLLPSSRGEARRSHFNIIMIVVKLHPYRYLLLVIELVTTREF